MGIKTDKLSFLSSIDEHTLEVIKKSSSLIVVKIGGMVAAFVVSIILVRTLGPEGLGIISLVNQIIAIALIFSILGMNNVIVKEFAIACKRKFSDRLPLHPSLIKQS